MTDIKMPERVWSDDCNNILVYPASSIDPYIKELEKKNDGLTGLVVVAQDVVKAHEKLLTEYEQLEADIKFLLSFAPDEPPPGLDPTFYHTLTHDGDMELSERIKDIRLRNT